MAGSWGTIEPRGASPWRLARLVSAPRAEHDGQNWRAARIELEFVDGGMAWMRLGELAKAMPQLASALAQVHDDGGLGAHQLRAALSLKNSGIPIAVIGDAGREVTRPTTLFATWNANGTRVVISPVHAERWLTRHAGKHLVRENVGVIKTALRDAGIPQASDIVRLIREWDGDVLDASAWPLLETYSLLLAVSFARPGPVQAQIRWRDRGDAMAETASTLSAELIADAGAWTARSAPGVDSFLCSTICALRSAAKGEAPLPKRWATMHPADIQSTRDRIDELRRFAALEVCALT